MPDSNKCLLSQVAVATITARMGLCAWPRGCTQDATPDDVRCYYHSKVIQGLIQADRFLFEARTGVPRKTRRMRLVNLLAGVGASPEVVSYAASVKLHPSHLARHGHGFIRQGHANGYRF